MSAMAFPVRALLTCLAVAVLAAGQAVAESWPGREWARQPVVPSAALAAFEAYAFPPRDEVERRGVRSDAVVAIRDGVLVYERYAAPTTEATPHLLWSISKSLLACLLGSAYGEGRFRLDDPAARYYPPLAAHPELRLRHLLNWTSGLAWEEDYEYAPLTSSVLAMLYTRGRKDMAGFAAQHAAGVAPGTRFSYSSGDSILLAATLKGMLVAGQYADYPWRALFEPLGITSAVWERDAAGTFVGASYAYMNARDLARVGLLMLRDGRWGERRLLPADWVAFNRAPVPGYRPRPEGLVPGGHWWLNLPLEGAPQPWPDVPADAFAALGHWGQALYVLPAERLVIVRFADDRDPSYRHNDFLRLARAAFVSGEAP
ncbi:CubicO group peptidase, beta-lactamase class C family [Azotobacter beijerinckii]|uniref:CubicO group peptidase, beta-lactamase class C family n=1 Tax=Azotobacter beijerinckii TaxID=170623 RepID=A0A1H9BVB6_9GAMM|nr:serine hydrolase [Azotobacter beijerinckii]SEP92844.1 CubicO group peptidase, beta-lactamase class C family [Azotobacter beijerinckii]